MKSRVLLGGWTSYSWVAVGLCSAGAYDITTAAHGVGRTACREAFIVVLPYLWGDCATPGGGTPCRLTLQACDGDCLILNIASVLLGVGVALNELLEPAARKEDLVD